MGEKGVGKLSRETPPPCEGEPKGAVMLPLCYWGCRDATVMLLGVQ